MKYLVVDVLGEERIYVFPQQESHKDVAKRLFGNDQYKKPIRGGTVMLESGHLICSGLGAFSLGLPGDRERDTKLLFDSLNQGI